MTCIECKVIVKDEHKKLVKDYLKYDSLDLRLESNDILHMVNDTMNQFKLEEGSEKPSIVVKTTMIFQ